MLSEQSTNVPRATQKRSRAQISECSLEEKTSISEPPRKKQKQNLNQIEFDPAGMPWTDEVAEHFSKSDHGYYYLPELPQLGRWKLVNSEKENGLIVKSKEIADAVVGMQERTKSIALDWAPSATALDLFLRMPLDGTKEQNLGVETAVFVDLLRSAGRETRLFAIVGMVQGLVADYKEPRFYVSAGKQLVVEVQTKIDRFLSEYDSVPQIMADKRVKPKPEWIQSNPQTDALFKEVRDGVYQSAVLGDGKKEYRKQDNYYKPGVWEPKANEVIELLDSSDDNDDAMKAELTANAHTSKINAVLLDVKDVKNVKNTMVLSKVHSVATMDPAVAHYLIQMSQKCPEVLTELACFVKSNDQFNQYEASQEYVKQKCPHYRGLNLPTSISAEDIEKLRFILKGRLITSLPLYRGMNLLQYQNMTQTVPMPPSNSNLSPFVPNISLPTLEIDENYSSNASTSESNRRKKRRKPRTKTKISKVRPRRGNKKQKKNAFDKSNVLKAVVGKKRVTATRACKQKRKKPAKVTFEEDKSNESSCDYEEEESNVISWSQAAESDKTLVFFWAHNEETTFVNPLNNDVKETKLQREVFRDMVAQTGVSHAIADDVGDFLKWFDQPSSVRSMYVVAAKKDYQKPIDVMFKTVFMGDRNLWQHCFCHKVDFVDAPCIDKIIKIQLLKIKQQVNAEWKWHGYLDICSTVLLLNHVLDVSFKSKTIPDMMAMARHPTTSKMHGLFLKEGLWDMGEFDDADCQNETVKKWIHLYDEEQFPKYFQALREAQKPRTAKQSKEFAKMKRQKMKKTKLFTEALDPDYSPNSDSDYECNNNTKQQLATSVNKKVTLKRARGRPRKEIAETVRPKEYGSNAATDYSLADLDAIIANCTFEQQKIILRHVAAAWYLASIALKPKLGKFFFPIDCFKYPPYEKQGSGHRDWRDVAKNYHIPRDLKTRLKKRLKVLLENVAIFIVFHRQFQKMGCTKTTLEAALAKHNLSAPVVAVDIKKYKKDKKIFPPQKTTKKLLKKRIIKLNVRINENDKETDEEDESHSDEQEEDESLSDLDDDDDENKSHEQDAQEAKVEADDNDNNVQREKVHSNATQVDNAKDEDNDIDQNKTGVEIISPVHGADGDVIVKSAIHQVMANVTLQAPAKAPAKANEQKERHASSDSPSVELLSPKPATEELVSCQIKYEPFGKKLTRNIVAQLPKKLANELALKEAYVLNELDAQTEECLRKFIKLLRTDSREQLKSATEYECVWKLFGKTFVQKMTE